MNSLKKKYNQIICDQLSICFEDLSSTELLIIDQSFDIIESKVKEIKELNDLIYRMNIEIRNLKSYNDNKDY